MENPLFTRQSIYDENLNVVAYELLFRQNNYDCADIGKSADTDHSMITSTKVLMHSIIDIGLETIANQLPLHIKITPKFLENLELIDLKYPIVLDIILDQEVSPGFLEKIVELKNISYKFSINDYLEASVHDISRLIPLCDIIKIDASTLTDHRLKEVLDELSNTDCKLLLKNIETQELFNKCKESKLSLFQGFFLGK
jgi:c-di-GMP-related signal transduction protein